MNKASWIFVSLLTIMIISTSCVPVKSYQKVYLNDIEMSLSNRKVESMQTNYLNYREGATGANESKTGGGCGCN
ncbi:DUF4266 domain-containing protein [Bacteroidota bacterium]